MPKGKKIDPRETLSWVKQLPEQGGLWGQGIIGTIEEVDRVIGEREQQLAKLTSEIQELKADIRQKKSFQRKTAKRAEKEVTELYANAQIEEAKAAAAKVKSDEEKAQAQTNAAAASNSDGDSKGKGKNKGKNAQASA